MHPNLAYQLARTLIDDQQRAAASHKRSRRESTDALEADSPARRRLLSRAILRVPRAR